MVPVLLLLCDAAPAAPIGSPLAAPFDTALPRTSPPAVSDEHVTVTGRRLRMAPVPGYGDDAAPWEAARTIRDPRTGADTSMFGNAYNLGSPLGSDERSNETGGSLVAPRHPQD